MATKKNAITSLDKATLRLLMSDVTAALSKLGTKYNLTFACDGGNYDRNGCYANLKLKVAVKNAKGETLSCERQDFIKLALVSNLKPEWLDKQVVVGRSTYTIIGLKPRSYAYPVLGKRSDGKVFKLSVNSVRMGFGLSPVATPPRRRRRRDWEY